MSNLTAEERETIILWNQAGPNATICAMDPVWIRKLADLASKSPSVVRVLERSDYVEYQVPKRWVKVQIPRQYSEDQKQLMRERITAIREAKNDTI